jgi:hypothetical protein
MWFDFNDFDGIATFLSGLVWNCSDLSHVSWVGLGFGWICPDSVGFAMILLEMLRFDRNCSDLVEFSQI